MCLVGRNGPRPRPGPHHYELGGGEAVRANTPLWHARVWGGVGTIPILMEIYENRTKFKSLTENRRTDDEHLTKKYEHCHAILISYNCIQIDRRWHCELSDQIGLHKNPPKVSIVEAGFFVNTTSRYTSEHNYINNPIIDV